MIIIRLIRVFLTSGMRFQRIRFAFSLARRFNFSRENDNGTPTDANDDLILSQDRFLISCNDGLMTFNLKLYLGNNQDGGWYESGYGYFRVFSVYFLHICG